MNQDEEIEKLEKELEKVSERKDELLKQKQIKKDMEKKAEEAMKQLDEEQKEKEQKEKEQKALKESEKLKEKSQIKKKEIPETEVDNIYIASTQKQKETVITINHQMNKELGSTLKKLQMSISGLTVAFIVFIFVIVAFGIFIFLNVESIDSWVRDIIVFTSGI